MNKQIVRRSCKIKLFMSMVCRQSTFLKIFVVTILSPTIAFAEGGFYTGIGAGYATTVGTVQNPFVFNSNGTTGTQSSSGIGSAIYFGYDFNRYVGIQSDYDVDFTTQVASSYSVNQQLLGASMVFHLPFSLFSNSLSGLSIFAKGGLDYDMVGFSGQPNCNNCVNPSGSNAGFVPVYGLGVEYGFTNVGYRLEWDGTGPIMNSNKGVSQTSISSSTVLLSILYHF